MHYRPYIVDDQLHRVLKAIKENDGFPGPLASRVREHIIGNLATVEISPLTGLDVQWTLTPEGKRKLTEFNRRQRYKAKHGDKWSRGRYAPPQQDAPVPITIEVLDALKAIRETGEPNTDKLDILARIQRYGIHAAKYVKDVNGENHLVSGALAEFKNGVWSLTDTGHRVEAGHIRKSQCAQFTGKVR